jgi:NAD+ kinase
MKDSIRTVGIIGKLSDPSVGGHATELARHLQRRGLEVVIEQSTASLLRLHGTVSRSIDAMGDVDLAVVIGGDGTMLRAARQLAAHKVPVIGINLGRVGFLADVPAEAMIVEVGKILDGHGDATERMLLSAEVLRAEKVVHEALALNDVVITKGELARLIEFETWLDAEFVSAMRADGIIIATPTGSTAYALSAGGPILYPDLPAIAVVPVCPHTLSQRPLVVPAQSAIEIVMKGAAPGQHAYVSFDGQTGFALADHDRVRVRRADISVKLLHPAGRSHFEVLRSKLHWGRTL